MIDYDNLITPSRESQCSTDRNKNSEYCTRELQVDVEEYSTLQKPKMLQNITYSPEINNSKKSSLGDFNNDNMQHMSPFRVFDTKPISVNSSNFAITKNQSPVSSSGRHKNGSPSMSPKKRGKRRIKENMENEEPFCMSNFNSNNSAKVSEGNLLSSNGSMYNLNTHSQITIQADSQGNQQSGTPPCQSHHLFEYQEEPINGRQNHTDFSFNQNRELSTSPTKMKHIERFVKIDPNQFANPYHPSRSKNSSISEVQESKFDLSVVKEASAFLEASSVGTKYKCKTSQVIVKEMITKSQSKKVEKTKEVKVGSFSSQARIQEARRIITKSIEDAPIKIDSTSTPTSPFDNLIKRTEKIKEKSALRRSQEQIKNYVSKKTNGPSQSPKKTKSPSKSPKKNRKPSESIQKSEQASLLTSEKSQVIFKTTADSGLKQRRQKSDRKKSNIKSGGKNDSIISQNGVFQFSSRVEYCEEKLKQAIIQPQIISQSTPQVQLIDNYTDYRKNRQNTNESITLSEIQQQAIELIQYEEELKHNLDNMHVPHIPANSVKSGTSGQTQQMMERYTKILDQVEIPFDFVNQQSIDETMLPITQFQLQCQSVVSEYQSNYFTKKEDDLALSNGRLETNQSCMLDHQNYYEDEINKMQIDLEELKQSEMDILTYNTKNQTDGFKMTPRNTNGILTQSSHREYMISEHTKQAVHIEYNESPLKQSPTKERYGTNPVKDLKHIINLVPGRNRQTKQSKEDLLSNLKEAQDHFDETSDEMSSQYYTHHLHEIPLGSPPTKQIQANAYLDNICLIKPIKIPQNCGMNLVLDSSPVKSDASSPFQLNLEGLKNISSCSSKGAGLICLQKMQSGSTPSGENNFESEESPQMFQLNKVDESPSNNRVSNPGCANLPDNIHPYAQVDSPDSFQLQPRLMNQEIQHKEQKSPIKARRDKKLSPQKTKVGKYFDEFECNRVENKIEEESQEQEAPPCSPRTNGDQETIRTGQSQNDTSKNGSKQRRSRKNRSKSGSKTSGAVRKTLVKQNRLETQHFDNHKACIKVEDVDDQTGKYVFKQINQDTQEVEPIQGPKFDEFVTPQISPRDGGNTMFEDQFDQTQESGSIIGQDFHKGPISSKSPSPERGVPINMVITRVGQTDNKTYEQIQIRESPDRKVQTFLSFDARHRQNIIPLEQEEQAYLTNQKPLVFDDACSSRSSMVDQLQGQLHQQSSPEQQDDNGLFGETDLSQSEQGEIEENFLPNTGSTCTAQFNDQQLSIMSIEMSQERSRHIKQISISDDDLQINEHKVHKQAKSNVEVDYRNYDSNESEINKILKESLAIKKKQLESLARLSDSYDTQKKQLNPELSSENPQFSVIDQFTFDESQKNKNSRKNAIEQAESLLALQRQAPKILVQKQKKQTNSVLSAILSTSNNIESNRSRCSLHDKPLSTISSKQSGQRLGGHQSSFYGEELNESVIQTPQQKYLETAKRLSVQTQINRLSKVKSAGRLQQIQTADQMNKLTSAVKDKMKEKYHQGVKEIVSESKKSSSGYQGKLLSLNKSQSELTPSGFDKTRKSMGFTSSQYFKKPEDLREKSGEKTKIGQGLFNRRTQSGAINQFLNASQSHNLLPAFDGSFDYESSNSRAKSRGQNCNIPNLNLTTSLKSLRHSVAQANNQVQKPSIVAGGPSARTTTPKPTTSTPSYMQTTKASAQKTAPQVTRVVKSSQKVTQASSRQGFSTGYKSTGRSSMQTQATNEKSVFQQRTRMAQGAVKAYVPANKYNQNQNQ